MYEKYSVEFVGCTNYSMIANNSYEAKQTINGELASNSQNSKHYKFEKILDHSGRLEYSTKN